MIKDVFDKINLHIKRAKYYVKEIKKWNNFDIDIFNDSEKIKTIDSFIFRFIKLQDTMGNRLFKNFLNLLGEYEDNMSLIDVLDKLEKFGFIDSTEKWIEIRQNRNLLTHEYPSEEIEILEGIKIALEQFEYMLNVYKKIYDFSKKRGFI